jgi:complex iron-sulfur molybdoenzyme family reductase subunit gamma
MAPSRREVAALVFAVALVAVGAFVPALAGGVPANQIPVAENVEDGDAYLEPDASAWAAVNGVQVSLTSAPSGVPSAADTTVNRLSVKTVRSEARFFIRLTWPDQTADQTADDPREFVDAVAVQLPTNGTTRPAIAMGSPRTTVNVWYWSADTGVEELLAGGPGSTTAFQTSGVEAAATHTDGRWQLVFARDATGGDGRTAIAPDRDLDIAFAVWNGSNMERSGQKAVSEWYTLALGPGPQGPPYQSLLWAIAGLAIVVVVIVTAIAVRRA